MTRYEFYNQNIKELQEICNSKWTLPPMSLEEAIEFLSKMKQVEVEVE